MRILCLKHVLFEGPALLAKWAHSRGHSLQVINAFETNEFPSVNEFEMLFIMGGPMNVYEESTHPWLKKEKRLIRNFIEVNKRVFGVCLGAQLIADCLRARVYQNDEKEIGWFPIKKTAKCPISLQFPETLTVLHWHGDTFDLPDGAINFAESQAYRNQAFLYQDHVIGLQFHIEMTKEHLSLICTACANELEQPSTYIQSAEKMLAEDDITFNNAERALFDLLDQWT